MSNAHRTSDAWNGLCDALEQLGEGTALETPVSERQFEIDAVVPDRVDVTYRDSGEELSLYRDQFEILFDRLAEEEIDLATPGWSVARSISSSARRSKRISNWSLYSDSSSPLSL